jgi:hypothetical protein
MDLPQARQIRDGRTRKSRSRSYYSASRKSLFSDRAMIDAGAWPIYLSCGEGLPHGVNEYKLRRSPMKKFIAIVALAMAVISAPAFAHAATFEDATHGAGIASQS